MAREDVSLGGPPPFPHLMGGCEEVGLMPLPSWVVFLGEEWEGHGIYLVPLTWSLGASEKNVYFRK